MLLFAIKLFQVFLTDDVCYVCRRRLEYPVHCGILDEIFNFKVIAGLNLYKVFSVGK